MKRLIIIILITLVVLAGGLYFLDQYWIHRYDSLIAREAALHHIDPDLVWSIVYEETYFSPWKKGRNGEIGLKNRYTHSNASPATRLQNGALTPAISNNVVSAA